MDWDRTKILRTLMLDKRGPWASHPGQGAFLLWHTWNAALKTFRWHQILMSSLRKTVRKTMMETLRDCEEDCREVSSQNCQVWNKLHWFDEKEFIQIRWNICVFSFEDVVWKGPDTEYSLRRRIWFHSFCFSPRCVRVEKLDTVVLTYTKPHPLSPVSPVDTVPGSDRGPVLVPKLILSLKHWSSLWQTLSCFLTAPLSTYADG